MSRTGIKMRSGAYAASRQDAEAGGYQDFRPPVHYQRSCCPDLGVYTSRFEGRTMLLGPLGPSTKFLSSLDPAGHVFTSRSPTSSQGAVSFRRNLLLRPGGKYRSACT
jgi:hypothetical protein